MAGITKEVTGQEPTFRKKNTELNRALLLSATLGLTAGPVATAQDKLEEVVVTALKREGTSLVDTAAGVAVVQGSQIEDWGATDLSDFLQRTPALSIDPGATMGWNTFQVRGVSATLGAATVGFYMDDLPFSLTRINTVPAVPVFDLAQVEVLRGPQGTLYGAGASGGVVVVSTLDPVMNEFGAKLDLSAYTIDDGGDGYVTSGAINVPLIDDTLAARAVVTYQDDDGWVTDALTGRDEINPSDKTDARLKLLWTPTDDLELVFLANTSESNSNGRGTIADDSGELFLDGTLWDPIDDSEYQIEYDQYGVTLKYDFENFRIFNSLSYIDLDRHLTFLPLPLTNDMDFESTSNEFRISSAGDSRLSWLAGVFYRDVENYTDVPLLSAGVGFPNVKDQLDSEQISIFGDATYELIQDKLFLSAGLSYFEDDLDFVVLWDPEFFPFENQDLSNDSDEVSSQVTLSYNPSEDSTAYVRWAEGFRPGNFNTSLGIVQVRLFTGDFGYNGAVSTETITAYEVGYKAEFMDGTAYTEIVFFYNDMDDPQLVGRYEAAGNAASAIINGESAESMGLEFVLALSPLDGLDLNFTASYTDAELTDDVFIGDVLQYEDGEEMTLVPEYMASGTAAYTWDVMNDLQATVSGSVQYISEKTLLVPSSPSIEGDETTLVNLRAELGNQTWSVYGFANNVTDEDGAVTPATPYLAGPPPQFVDGIYANRYRPRSYGIGLRYNY